MRLDELPTSDRIEDRRGVGTSRAGLGIGTVVVLGLIGWALGIDPRLLIGGAEMISRNEPTQQQGEVKTGAPSGRGGTSGWPRVGDAALPSVRWASS